LSIGVEILHAETHFDAAYRFAAHHLAREYHTAAVLDYDKLRTYAARGLIGTGIAGGVNDIDRVVSLIERRGIMLKASRSPSSSACPATRCG
jgi:hypothetical protein